MPLSRYLIKNQYRLADPKVYTSVDSDDSDGVFEALTLAGLVGIIRQLGDFAEFAAEVFCGLHEEVMAVGARGHGLRVRVQQLEEEIPSIEKEFFSQIDHSTLFKNPGVDWHPNPHIEENMITGAHMPRYMMDFYEQCRGPPQLFLLDKFDVAGAGGCLKRYTDPSIFKKEDESSIIMSWKVERGKRFRKSKKKRQYWRNGENKEAEISHMKLYELLTSKDDTQDGGSVFPARAKLKKRQLNGTIFDPVTGKSSLEKLLQAHRLDQNPEPYAAHTDSRTCSDISDIETEITVVRTVSHSPPPKGRPPRSPTAASAPLNGKPGDRVTGAARTTSEQYSLDDDISSEVDDYADAFTTVDSEVDTESTRRVKWSFHVEKLGVGSEPREISGDSHSNRISEVSEEGNGSLDKGRFQSFSDSLSTAGNIPSDEDEVTKTSSGIFRTPVGYENSGVDMQLSSCESGTGNGYRGIEQIGKMMSVSPESSPGDVLVPASVDRSLDKAVILLEASGTDRDSNHVAEVLFSDGAEEEEDNRENSTGCSAPFPPGVDIPLDGNGVRAEEEDVPPLPPLPPLQWRRIRNLRRALLQSEPTTCLNTSHGFSIDRPSSHSLISPNSAGRTHLWPQATLDLPARASATSSPPTSHSFPDLSKITAPSPVPASVSDPETAARTSTASPVSDPETSVVVNETSPVVEPSPLVKLSPAVETVELSPTVEAVEPSPMVEAVELSPTVEAVELSPTVEVVELSTTVEAVELSPTVEESPTVVVIQPRAINRAVEMSCEDIGGGSDSVSPTWGDGGRPQYRDGCREKAVEGGGEERDAEETVAEVSGNSGREIQEVVVSPAAPASVEDVKRGFGEDDGDSFKLHRVLPSLATLEKIKLKKVSDMARGRPPIAPAVSGGRHSLLEQIRTKSFNLRPTGSTRPVIRAPGTNLKVAAILEKANSIRQALAGSDDEDSDAWSDT